MQGKKIVAVVDDEIDITTSFKIILEREGFIVETYNDPLLVLEEFKPNFYDMMIIDIRMTPLDGFELYDKLRKRDKKFKVCFISAYEINYQALRDIFNLSNFVPYLKKPISSEKLINIIKKELQLL